MSRRLVSLAALLMIVVGGAGCRVAYLPGEEPAAAPTGDPVALRRAVRVLPAGCTDREAKATVANRSAKALAVTVEVHWATGAGGSVGATAKVTVPPRAERPVTVPAPAGASADVGCQAAAQAVTAAG